MKVYFLDAFTNELFKGNQAAICFVDSSISNETKQKIALELGFSETAFLEYNKDDLFNISYFSPKNEIDLCGHATLAASKVLFEQNNLRQVRFITKNNLILESYRENDSVKMFFPKLNLIDIEIPEKLTASLGIKDIVNKKYNLEYKMILIEISNESDLINLKPDYESLVNSYSGINGVCVTSKSIEKRFDFKYRYFWPWSGTNEDPVTGAVQTFLTPYWSKKLNKNILHSFQASQRSGEMVTTLENDKISILGNAVLFLKGEIIL